MEQDINNLKNCMNLLKKDLSFIRESMVSYHANNKEEHEKIIEKLDKWIISSKKEFAPKWVADVMKFIIGAIGLALIGALMVLILK